MTSKLLDLLGETMPYLVIAKRDLINHTQPEQIYHDKEIRKLDKLMNDINNILTQESMP